MAAIFFVATLHFVLELSTQKQMNDLMAECKVTIPEITKKMRAVQDDDTDLKQIMDQAQKERENSAKVPELQVKSVQKKTDDGKVVTVEKYSEC